MIAISASPIVINVTEIAYVTPEEAYSLLATEFERFMKLVNKLDSEDWSKPTACTAWNVRDMLAHQAGGYASGSSYKEFFRQSSRIMLKPGGLPEDVINEFQLRERAAKSPAELIAELNKVGPLAARNWAYHFRLFKLFAIPHPGVGMLSLRHLMWVIHSRDTWMHRLDICRATGQFFEQNAANDGRIAELVMRDVAEVFSRKIGGPALLFELTGIAGGTWKVGHGEPAAAIRMDVLDFNIFASGRYSYEQARSLATISGDVQVAENALQKILVLY